jgi:hypothetical protein
MTPRNSSAEIVRNILASAAVLEKDRAAEHLE